MTKSPWLALDAGTGVKDDEARISKRQPKKSPIQVLQQKA